MESNGDAGSFNRIQSGDALPISAGWSPDCGGAEVAKA
jgi:hypothetical protein